MAQKNIYLFRGEISERKFRDLVRIFALDITADRAAALTGLNPKTTTALYTLLRQRMADLALKECPFQGQIEVDESYFGPARVRGRPGRGAGKKTPVFGILERGGRVHCQIVRNCSKSTLQTILKGRVEQTSEIHSDGFRAYDGLVEAGFAKHHRIKHGDGEFALDNAHINGIESFWSFAKRRMAKFNGIRKTSFPVFLKETEFRFNTRDGDLYRIMLKSCREKPLRQPQLV